MAPARHAGADRLPDQRRFAVDARSPGLRKRYEDIGTFPRPASVEETHAFIKAEQDMWRPIVRQIGAQ